MVNQFIRGLFGKSTHAAESAKTYREGVTVITTMHRSGFDQYGKEFLEGFLRAWPDDCKLVFYAEDFQVQESSSRIKVMDLHQQVPKLLAFKRKHNNTPIARGMTKSGYDYRFDAVRFSNKAYVLGHAAAHCDTRYMVWLDADTSMFQRIPSNFIERVLDGGLFMAYLGRFGNHSEAGFLPFDLTHAGSGEFFSTLNDIYESDELFKVREWHDSHIIDCCRSILSARGVILARDLNVHGVAHPFVNSAPGLFMDHKKGPDRKVKQRSRSSDYVIPPYWDVDWHDEIWTELADALCPDEVIGLNLHSSWSAVRMIMPALAAGESTHYTGLYGDAFQGRMKEDGKLFQTIQSVYPEFSYALELAASSADLAIEGSRSLAILGAIPATQTSTLEMFGRQPGLSLLAERAIEDVPIGELSALRLEHRQGTRGAQLLRAVDPTQLQRIDQVLGR